MKRLTALLLFFMLAMLPLSALAAPAVPLPPISAPSPANMPALSSPVPYNVTGTAASVTIWGRELNATTPYYVNGASGAQGSVHSTVPAAWNAHYNAATGVLTLDRLNVTNSDGTINSAVCGIYANGSVTMELAGDSIVSTADGSASCYAIYMDGGDLTLRGAGTLLVTSGTAPSSSYGVIVTGALTVSGGTLTATAHTAQQSIGLLVAGDAGVSGGSVGGTGGSIPAEQLAASRGVAVYGALAVSGDGKLAGTSGSEINGTGARDGHTSWGVLAAGGLTVSDSGEITGTGGAVAGGTSPGQVHCSSIGVHADSSLTASGNGKITATGRESNGWYGDSYGVYTDGAFTVSGGTLTATGGEATGQQGKSCGAFIRGALTASGGTLTARAGKSTGVTGSSYGLCIYGDTNVTGGTLGGAGGDADGDSYGAYCFTLTVSGGRLSGTGAKGVTSFGVASGGTLTISGNGEVSGTGGEAQGGGASNQARYASIGAYAGGLRLESNGALTAKCAAPSDTNTYSYGVYSDPIVVTGGRLTVETATPASSYMNALAVVPELYCPSYFWRTARAGDYTHSENGSNPFRWANLQTYVDIRGNMLVQPGIDEAFSEIPDTGDTANAALWACVAILAAGALARRKRKAARKPE